MTFHDTETPIPPDTLIVSKSDLAGRITYANTALVKVSEYSESELLGQPHKIFRHADTPKGVFHWFWQRLNDGHEVFAPVKNRTKSGGCYWVWAHVTPTWDNASGEVVGFHSSRRALPPQLRDAVEPLYASMLEVEGATTDRKPSAEAGARWLLSELATEDWTGVERWFFERINHTTENAA